jgi:hypothetical protein
MEEWVKRLGGGRVGGKDGEAEEFCWERIFEGVGDQKPGETAEAMAGIYER